MCSQNIPVYFSLSHFLPSIGPNTLQVLLVIRWYGKSKSQLLYSPVSILDYTYEYSQ